MIQTFSIKDARNNLADIVSRVEMAGDEIVITKFGKPRVRIVSLLKTQIPSSNLRETAGAWKNRNDIKDTAEWVAELRSRMSKRG